ncbi:MAG: hypothetical protein ACKVT1_00845 [Dehalococcoidia bacterium]
MVSLLSYPAGDPGEVRPEAWRDEWRPKPNCDSWAGARVVDRRGWIGNDVAFEPVRMSYGRLQAPRSNCVQKLDAISMLDGAWAGATTILPSDQTMATARLLADNLTIDCNAVSPTADGTILFEWELARRLSVFAHVKGPQVGVSVFDDEHDFADLDLPASAAAMVVSGLVSGSRQQLSTKSTG